MCGQCDAFLPLSPWGILVGLGLEQSTPYHAGCPVGASLTLCLPTESNRRSSLSVLIPITAAVVTCLVGVCIYCLVHTGEGLRHMNCCLG